LDREIATQASVPSSQAASLVGVDSTWSQLRKSESGQCKFIGYPRGAPACAGICGRAAEPTSKSALTARVVTATPSASDAPAVHSIRRIAVCGGISAADEACHGAHETPPSAFEIAAKRREQRGNRNEHRKDQLVDWTGRTRIDICISGLPRQQGQQSCQRQQSQGDIGPSMGPSVNLRPARYLRRIRERRTVVILCRHKFSLARFLKGLPGLRAGHT